VYVCTAPHIFISIFFWLENGGSETAVVQLVTDVGDILKEPREREKPHYSILLVHIYEYIVRMQHVGIHLQSIFLSTKERERESREEALGREGSRDPSLFLFSSRRRRRLKRGLPIASSLGGCA